MLPETDDFIDLILESEAPLAIDEQCAVAELPFIRPSLPIESADGLERKTWDERLVTANWTANAVRDYDPVRSAKIVGENKMVQAVDIGDIPASSPTSPMPGLPFGLIVSPVFNLKVSKRTDPLPFYHRNTRRNEFEFVHLGGGDQDTELGYIYGQGRERRHRRRGARPIDPRQRAAGGRRPTWRKHGFGRSRWPSATGAGRRSAPRWRRAASMA